MFVTTLTKAGDPSVGSAVAQPCYRIPALVVSSSGRLITAWDVRPDWRDLPGPIDVAFRTSDDNGTTWNPTRFLRQHQGNQGFGDASLLVDPASGDVLCWYASSIGRSFFDSEAGPDGDGLQLWLARSKDDGESWSHRDLTTWLKPWWAIGMFASSGNGIALSSGRLLQPFVALDADGQHWAILAHSDDGGFDWTLGEPIGPDCDENKAVELPASGSTPERVLLHARATPRRKQAYSLDGGITFAPPQAHPALVDPACNGGLAIWGGVVACSLLDDPEDRRNLGLRFSRDDGKSWSGSITIDTGAAAYSVVAELADGSLGIVWEAGDYAEIRFARVTPEEIDLTRIGRHDHLPTLEPVNSAGEAAKPPEVAT